MSLLVLLMACFTLAWMYGRANDRRETVAFSPTEKIIIFDGDSFRIGPREYRLDGIDAPEYRQSCKDAAGQDWACGKAARGSLETLLRQPALSCVTQGQDKYSRLITICKTKATADIAATQVQAGLALSDEFNGIKSYGTEEESARDAKRGIWQGEFVEPAKWRSLNENERPSR